MRAGVVTSSSLHEAQTTERQEANTVSELSVVLQKLWVLAFSPIASLKARLRQEMALQATCCIDTFSQGKFLN